MFIGALLVAYGLLNYRREVAAPKENSQNRQESGTDNNAGKANGTDKAAFDKNRYSLNEPGSLWVVVNKKRPLPAGYVPADLRAAGDSQLRAEAKDALDQLLEGARQEEIRLKIISGYRSYAAQQSLYRSYVQKDGQAAADTYSARAGHSEHQTGLAADVGNTDNSCNLETCFARTGGGLWIIRHAPEYGFTLSYPEGKTAVTGYQYEPWHLRYVGKDLAGELHRENRTMQEFFGLAAAPGY